MAKAPGMTGFRLMTPPLKGIFRFWYTPKLIGKEKIPKNGALVIACNHKHVLDQCLTILATHRPINYLAKCEYFQGRHRWFFRVAGCISVNRNGHDTAATETALAVLKKKGAVGIFPEGTRNRTDAFMLPLHFGAVSMAKKGGAVLLPVAVTGDYKFRSKTLAARFGDPIHLDSLTLEQANEKLQKAIEMLMLQNIDEGYASALEKEKAERFFPAGQRSCD